MGDFLDSLSEGWEYLTDREGVEARKREDDSYQRFVSFMEDSRYGPDKVDQDFFNKRFSQSDPQNFQKFLDRYNAQQAQTQKMLEVTKKIKENPDYTPPLTEEQQKWIDYGMSLEKVLDMTGGYVSEVSGEPWGGPGTYYTGGRVGLALGGDPYMEDYRDKTLEDPILEPGDEMLPDDAQGLVSMLQDEQDPERKIMLAIQIIQSMGDRGIEIVESILSPEEIAMAVQVIQQMDTGADQGIDNVQMAAEGGRIGFGGGGDLTARRMEQAAQRRRLGREGKFKDTADMYSWLSTSDPTYREESFRDPMWQQWWADPENIGVGSPHGDVEAWKRAVIESGDPRGLFSGTITDTKYRSPEEIAQSKRYLDHYNRMASVLGMDPSSIASGAESQLSSEVAPWAEPAPAPITYPAETAAAPVITTPAAVPAATGPAPVLESLNPMTYQTSYTTPTVADPTTNMSQYYSDALSTPYYDFQASAFGEPATTTAANVAAQYLNPQEAQVYQGAANGGRIGFANGGDEKFDPFKYSRGIDDMWQSEEIGSDPMSTIIKMGMTVRAPLIDVVRSVAKTASEATKIIADLTKKGFDVTKPARDAIGTAAGEGAEFLIEDMYDAGRFLSPRYYGQKYDTGRTLSDAETRLVMQLDNTVGRSDPERIKKLKEKVFKETYGSDPVDKSSIQLAPGIMTGKSKLISKADGGRIGFQDGGDDYQSPPFIDDPAGTFDTDPMELREMIESEGTLKTASSMGDVFMQAMEDSSVLELDSWLMKYEPYGLREDDYFNFRTMGPQARGPEATEGLASLRV